MARSSHWNARTFTGWSVDCQYITYLRLTKNRTSLFEASKSIGGWFDSRFISVYNFLFGNERRKFLRMRECPSVCAYIWKYIAKCTKIEMEKIRTVLQSGTLSIFVASGRYFIQLRYLKTFSPSENVEFLRLFVFSSAQPWHFYKNAFGLDFLRRNKDLGSIYIYMDGSKCVLFTVRCRSNCCGLNKAYGRKNIKKETSFYDELKETVFSCWLLVASARTLQNGSVHKHKIKALGVEEMRGCFFFSWEVTFARGSKRRWDVPTWDTSVISFPETFQICRSERNEKTVMKFSKTVYENMSIFEFQNDVHVSLFPIYDTPFRRQQLSTRMKTSIQNVTKSCEEIEDCSIAKF